MPVGDGRAAPRAAEGLVPLRERRISGALLPARGGSDVTCLPRRQVPPGGRGAPAWRPIPAQVEAVLGGRAEQRSEGRALILFECSVRCSIAWAADHGPGRGAIGGRHDADMAKVTAHGVVIAVMPRSRR